MKKSKILETNEKELAEIQKEIVMAGKNNPVDFIKHLCDLDDDEMINKTWIAYLYLSTCEEPIIASLSSVMVASVKSICNPLYMLKRVNAPDHVKKQFAEVMGIYDFEKLLDIAEIVIEMQTQQIQMN